jgi:hypothetical protein
LPRSGRGRRSTTTGRQCGAARRGYVDSGAGADRAVRALPCVTAGRSCVGCGAAYTPGHWRQVYCRSACRVAACRGRKRRTTIAGARLVGVFCYCRSCRRLVPAASALPLLDGGGYACWGCLP